MESNKHPLPEPGDRVSLICVSSNTPEEDRKPYWRETIGTAMVPVQLQGPFVIEREDPKLPKFFTTSFIQEINRNPDGAFLLRTDNSVYELRFI